MILVEAPVNDTLAAGKIFRVQDTAILARRPVTLAEHSIHSYLSACLSTRISNITNLPFSCEKRLKFPKVNLKSFGDGAFSFIAPSASEQMEVGVERRVGGEGWKRRKR